MAKIIKLCLSIIPLIFSVTGYILDSSMGMGSFSKYRALSIQAGEPLEFPNARDIGKRNAPSSLKPPDVHSFHIHSDIRYRYCRTNVVSKLYNPNSGNSSEVTFRVVIPDTAFISKFFMKIDGKTYKAFVKKKEEARHIYNEARRRSETAGLVEINARDSNIFNVNVNVKAHANVTFDLTYEEMLDRKLGRYEHAISINSEEISQIKDYKVTVNIVESQNISLLRVPNLSNEIELVEDNEGNNPNARIERPTGKSASISWSPTEREQIRLIEQGIHGKFVVQYDINRETDAGEILLMNGYFVHFFVPKSVLPLRKHVTFVLDVSGSMSGRNIEQLKSAMKYVLDDLKPDDYFNILTFQSTVTLWTPGDKSVARHLRRFPFIASEENLKKAHHFVKRISPNGGTNINAALLEALALCKSVKPEKSVKELPILRSRREISENDSDDGEDKITKLPQNVESIIIFLTDGQPTVGLTNTESILTSVKGANVNSIPIFSIAFGNSADFPFIKKLALQNRGFGRKIYEASDADLQMKELYKEISSPLLTNITFKYTSDNYAVTKLTSQTFPAHFRGAEIAVAGRFIPKNPKPVVGVELTTLESTPPPLITNSSAPVAESSGNAIIGVDIDANGRDGKIAYNQYDLLENDLSVAPTPSDNENRSQELSITGNMTATNPQDVEDLFLERLWAYLTVRQLIDKSVAQKKGIYLPEDSNESNEVESDEGGPFRLPKTPKPDEGPKTKALRLALKYGFVTPLTSLVVIKPNDTHNAPNEPNVLPIVPANPRKSTSYSAFAVPPNPSSWSRSSSSGITPGLEKYAAPRSRGYARYGGGGGQAINFRRGSISDGARISQSYRSSVRDSIASSHRDAIQQIEKESLSAHQERLRNAIQQLSEASRQEQAMFERGTLARPPYSSSLPRPRLVATSTEASVKTLVDVPWYHRAMKFVLVNETRYTIDAREYPTPTTAYDCTVQQHSSISNGVCKHLNQCVQDAFLYDINTYMTSYFCPLSGNKSNFAGVCCPKAFRNFVYVA